MSRKGLLLVFGLPLLLSGCVGLQVSTGSVSFTDSGTQTGILFTSRDRSIIARYYKVHRTIKPTPPGLARKQYNLPPGLVKRDRLPYGLRERGLPGDLDRQLHPLPSGYVRLVIGNDLVIMKRSNRVVMDIYRDVVR